MDTITFDSVPSIRATMDSQGSYYFSPDTMRFFNARPLDKVYGGRVFVESVRPPDGERHYAIKLVEWSPDNGYTIQTIGELLTSTSSDAAKSCASVLGAMCHRGEVPLYLEYGDDDRLAEAIGWG